MEVRPRPDLSGRGVEQAQPHLDQSTTAALTDHLDREPATGPPHDGGDRDAQDVAHSRGRDVHRDRGPVEPSCLVRVVEAEVRRDRRRTRVLVLPGGLGDSPEAVHLPGHRPVAGQGDPGAVALLHLTLLDVSRATRTSSVSDVPCATGAPGRRTSQGGGHLGDPHRVGQEHRLIGSKLSGLVQARGPLELHEALLGLRGEVDTDGLAVTERAQVLVELTDVATMVAGAQAAVRRDRAAQQQHRAAIAR